MVCLDCKSGAQLVTPRLFDRLESAGKLQHRISLPDLAMAVWPWSTLPDQSACAGSSEKRIWPDCQGTNGPRSVWFPETRGTAGLIPGIGQYWPRIIDLEIN